MSDPKAIALEILQESMLGLAVFDRQGRPRLCNPAFRDVFGMDSCPPRHDDRTTCGGCTNFWNENRARQPLDPGSSADRHYTLTLAGDKSLLVNEIERHDGWLTVLTQDISRLKTDAFTLLSARDKALLAANTDALTGLVNRRFMEEKIQAWLALSGPAKTFCACLLDIDHFKRINDTYGHIAGDQAIQHFARQAQECLRPTDILGRIGGEEFLLLLPGAHAGEAARVMSRLRGAFEDGFLTRDGLRIRFTFSAGITVSRAGDTWPDILARADRALYRAKRSGRDRYVTSLPEPRESRS
jgi:diguanylate cyclase (GGDEF)-like protein